MKSPLFNRHTLVSCILCVSVICIADASATAQEGFLRAPINYTTAATTGPIARLQKKIAAGDVRLKFQGRQGYLKSLLENLGVPESSQGLVYSKTSFQASLIAPRTPRAVYFGDDIYISFVQGSSVLEISAVDPNLGAVFYSLEQTETAKPTFKRRTHECLQCHAGSRTMGVPGHMVRSVFSQADGQPIYRAGTYTSNHGSPLAERWGGWYVTGTHGKQQLMGNILFRESEALRNPDLSKGANVTDLQGRFNTSAYLSPHSDIVALMVMEHQVNMHNLIAKASIQTRIALSDNAGMNRFFKRPADYRSESTKSRIASVGEKLLKHLLFVGEAKLTGRIEGTTSFARDFAARGPVDKRGRSLRQFDMKTRMFQYPCSYLIYSDAFVRLPKEVKTHIYRRLWDVLTGKDKTETYSHLCAVDRKAILEILRETKRDLPGYWKPVKGREPTENARP